jgi:hypothetical protein
MRVRFLVSIVIFTLLLGTGTFNSGSLKTTCGLAAEVRGELRQWHTVTLAFHGPTVDEQGEVSPFERFQLTARLVHVETGRAYDLLGFFAADGRAAETSATSGNEWHVRFSPPLTGRWQYKAAWASDTATAGLDPSAELDGAEGEFEVAESDKTEPDFRAHGHLEYVGERYLRFAGSGQYFLKAGVDSPETLLGYADFDGTWRDLEQRDLPAWQSIIPLPSLENGLHRYAPHVKDWKPGDPTWKSGLGKGLIGALNYLASQGMNSVYFLTMNVNGDGRNVWPWTAPTAFNRFDVSKLEQWEIVFEHMQRLGLQMHIVLQETENDHLLDGGELGPERKLYLRELIARFAHHPAVVWNLGEENLQTVEQREAMAGFIHAHDPYRHPIVVHNDHWAAKNLRDTFEPHLGSQTLDGTSIQDFNWDDIHGHVRYYVEASANSGKPWVVCSDEMGGANYGLLPDEQDPTHDIPRAKGLWGNLMAGGAGVEWYFGWQNNSPTSDLSAEEWMSRENMWKQSKIAIDFFHRYLPFDVMHAADELTSASSDYVFAKEGELVCVYLPQGGTTRLNLKDSVGPFAVHWFNPQQGGELQPGTIQAIHQTGWVDIGEPVSKRQGDWVALIRRGTPVAECDAAGNLFVEAEHFAAQEQDAIRQWYLLEKSGSLPLLEGAGRAEQWTRSLQAAASAASGNQFLRLLPDTRRTHSDPLIAGENFSAAPGKMAILKYRVHLPKPGRYYVWVRAFSTGTEDNGLHVGLNDQWPASGQRMQWCDGKHQWTWGCAQRTDENHCGEPMKIFLDVDQAGLHTICFSMREDGFAFDKFALSPDIDFRPVGKGGPENTRFLDLTGEAKDLPE